MMNTGRSILTLLGAALPALLLGACVSEPTPTELAFGDSVRQIVKAQTYDPSTLSSPSEKTGAGTDGQRLGNALDVYRRDVSKPAAATNEVPISVNGDGR